MRTRTQLSLLIASILALTAVHAQNDDGAQNTETTEGAASTGPRSTSPADTSSPSSSDQSQDRSNAAGSQNASGQSQEAWRTAEAGARAGERSAGATVLPVVTVLVPVAMEKKSDATLSNGCWAKLYSENSLKGDSLTLVGPVDMPDMTGPFGAEWNDIDSIQAGPRATVIIYDNENYRDRAATVKSGQAVNELSEKLGFFEEVNSIRINCAGGAG